jgi:hypothetical protein
MKAKVTLSIGFVGATHEDIIEIDDDIYNECKTDKEKADLLDDYWDEWAGNYINGSIDIVE